MSTNTETKKLSCAVCKKVETAFDRNHVEITEEESNTIKNQTSNDEEFLEKLDELIKSKIPEKTNIFDEVCGIYEGDLVGGLVCSDECKDTFTKTPDKYLPEMTPIIVTVKEEDDNKIWHF